MFYEVSIPYKTKRDNTEMLSLCLFKYASVIVNVLLMSKDFLIEGRKLVQNK